MDHFNLSETIDRAFKQRNESFICAFSSPKMPDPVVAEPVPQPEDPEVQAKISAAEAEQAQRSKRGRSSTILTGPQGLLASNTSSSNTLSPNRGTTNGKY